MPIYGYATFIFCSSKFRLECFVPAVVKHLTLPQSLTLLLTQRTMGMSRGVLLGTVESCVEKLAE
jgi:hypothetical protein